MDLRSQAVRAARLRQMRGFLLGRFVEAGEADAFGNGAAAVGDGEGLGVKGAGVGSPERMRRPGGKGWMWERLSPRPR